MVNKVLLPLVDKCFSKALNIRHGAILGVAEILIGLSGNSIVNRDELLEEAYKTLGKKERKLIADSENKKAFKEVYENLSKKDHLREVIKEDSESMTVLRGIVKRIQKEGLYKGNYRTCFFTKTSRFHHIIVYTTILCSWYDWHGIFKEQTLILKPDSDIFDIVDEQLLHFHSAKKTP